VTHRNIWLSDSAEHSNATVPDVLRISTAEFSGTGVLTCQYPAERSRSVVGYVVIAKEWVSFEYGEYRDNVFSQDVDEAIVAEENFSYAISA